LRLEKGVDEGIYHEDTKDAKKASGATDPYDTPPWRSSHKALSPNGNVVAEIKQAVEHSMGNPTTGTLRMSDGLELTDCNPSFVWSNDSRFLAVPRWCRRFGLFRRQRLVIVDVVERIAYVSRFTYWLMLPTTFERGRLTLRISHWVGISWWREAPLTLTLPMDLSTFRKLKSAYR